MRLAKDEQMSENHSSNGKRLNLKAGDWVEVRSQEEILATLDERGRLENLPFMPEMLQYCGQSLRVFKRADKTCNYVRGWSIRRMKDSVHLEGLRCDGTGHDGCEAGCLIFWKEAWLKRTQDSFVPRTDLLKTRAGVAGGGARCTVECIQAASRTRSPDGDTVYSCQAMQLLDFTSFMRWWDPRQYVRDLLSGNLSSSLAADLPSHRLLELLLDILQVLRAMIISVFLERRGVRYPFIAGTQDKGSIESLELQPGELVQVRGKDEIMATLEKNQRHRGLWFDAEMLPYCGGIYRVLRQVHQIIDENTGKMRHMKHPCIILEGVVCRSDYHRLCPRSIYPYWRENWLRRAVDASFPPPPKCESAIHEQRKGNS
jgi:hypothetical protein